MLNIGDKFNNLEIINLSNRKSKNNRSKYYICKCICGKVKDIREDSIKSGRIKSCGCSKKGRSGRQKTHGLVNTKEYRTWASIKSRCLNKRNPKYEKYGGRGITICSEWSNSFEVFLEDVGICPSTCSSLDRIDNNLGYFKENVRWADNKVQANNRSNNVNITYKDITQTISMWSKQTGINRRTISRRLSRGWDIEKTLTTPVKERTNHTDGKIIWRKMISRCVNDKDPAYTSYGARGIFVCKRWLISYDNFIEDMGFRPNINYSLDRINNEDGYYKENCRWATDKEQANNTRKNIIIEYKGKRMSLAEWARELGVKYEKLKYRYHKGLNPEEIFNFNQEDK